MSYNTWEDVKPQEGKQELACSLFGKVDFMLLGGARFGGKSEISTMIPCFFCDDPNFRATYFRTQYSEIMDSNGLWDKANNMYPLFDAESNISNVSWTFPSGARVQYRHMNTEKVAKKYRGSGHTAIIFDEIDHFEQDWVTFLMTCLRSEAEVDSFMVGTLNPDPDSWCLPLVEWYLDDRGFPDKDKVGVVRHFIVYEGEIIFGDSEEFFKENFPQALWVKNENTGEEVYTRPKTFTYMFFNIFDNPMGIAANPAYLSELNNLPDHERDTQLYGNWYSRPDNNSMWKRKWVRGEEGERIKSAADIPSGIKWYRGWDKAYTPPHDGNKYPDYNCGIMKMGKDRNNFYWIVGDLHDDTWCTYDKKQKESEPHKRVLGRFRDTPAERDLKILKQAIHDGRGCSVVLTKDSGGGTTDHTTTKALLVSEGISVVEDKSAKNTKGKKVQDFIPFCKACQLGLVFIVESTFNPETLAHLYKVLENFSEEQKSTGLNKDDEVDQASITFAACQSRRNHKITKRKQVDFKTSASTVIGGK